LKAGLLALVLLVVLLKSHAPAMGMRHNDRPSAQNGILDLSGWEPGETARVTLDGTWEFYWESLLSPESFHGKNPPVPTGYIKVPGLWNRFMKNSRHLPRDGYATFRLTLIHPPVSEEPLFLYMREVPTAYRLWINGKEAASNGSVGTSEESMAPWFLPAMIRIDGGRESIELVLQVSNYYHKDGGLWYSIELGSGSTFSMKSMRLMLFDMLFFGSLMIMGIYHLALYTLRPKDKTPLYFALFCLCIGLRSVMIGQRITYMLFPGVSWIIQQKLEFILLYLSFPAFILFFHHMFPMDVSLRLIRTVNGVILLLVFAVASLKVKVFSHTSIVFQVLLFLMVGYILARLSRIVRKKREGGVLFMGGFIVLVIAAVHDTLYTHLLIQSRSVAHVSAFLFIIFQSFLLSKKFSGAFRTVEGMTVELKEKNRKLMEADELKNEFLANTSHELRTPLHGIMGLAESMLSVNADNLDSRQKKSLSLIASSGRRLFNLINDLLDYSKIRNHDITLDLRPVDLKALCRLVMDFSAPLLSGKPVTMEDAVPDDLPPVMADEDRLQQILFNLVGNAVKFTPKGRITISAVRSGSSIKVTVSDTGIGIADEDQARVFNAFEQADGSAERKFPGTGLGLAISQTLVTLHGDRIQLKSRPDSGSEFFFSLKIAEGPVSASSGTLAMNRTWLHLPQAGEETVRAQETMDHGSEGKTILVVDDEPVNLTLLCNYLEKEGRYVVITAGNGHEALEKMEERPDLVLLDIMMPGMNGFEVCRELRKNPETKTLPVIILSARNQIADLIQGLESGANDYLPKPFCEEELLARVKAHLKAADAVREHEINMRLTDEIKQRQTVEQDLRVSRRKLASILDISPEAIMVADSTGAITFFNHGATHLFGFTTNEAIHQSLDLVFDRSSMDSLRRHGDVLRDHPLERQSAEVRCKAHDGTSFHARAFISSFRIGNEPYYTFIVKRSEEGHGGNGEFSAIQAIENSVENISDDISRKAHALQDGPLADENTGEDEPGAGQDETFRRQIVETMASALACWEISTGKTRIELSEESGIWKAYLDGGTWKTRTLDKYLNIRSLPVKPRWREVLRTAQYVLSKSDGSSASASRLRECAVELEKTIRYTRKNGAASHAFDTDRIARNPVPDH
jgi:two-component system sensor histidine kinase ChiS